MFQQHSNVSITSRSTSFINCTPRKLTKISTPSNGGSALKKNDEFHSKIEYYKQKEQSYIKQEEEYKQRENNYKKIIFAKEQEITMLKSHIQSLENNVNQTQISQQIQKQIQDLTQQVQMLLESYNQRILEIENLKKSQGQDHTELERQVLQLLRENSQLMNSLTMTHSFNEQTSQKNSISNISKISNTDNSWKQRFIKLNKEFHELQERYTMLQAELDNCRQNFRSPSMESFEAIIRY